MNIQEIRKLIGQMTLEEKAGLLSGDDFWHTKAVERLGVPRSMVSDGPHGLRKQDEEGDHLGINDSIKAVCFPAASATAASFDPDLIRKMGESLGEACQHEKLSVLLGPAEIPPEHPLYREGKRQVLVYRFYPVSSSPVAAFAAADALAKRNLNRRAAALGRRPRLFRLIRSRRLPAALPAGETLLSLTFKRSGSKLCLRAKRLPIAKNRRSQGPHPANTARRLPRTGTNRGRLGTVPKSPRCRRCGFVIS